MPSSVKIFKSGTLPAKADNTPKVLYGNCHNCKCQFSVEPRECRTDYTVRRIYKTFLCPTDGCNVILEVTPVKYF